MVFSNADLLSSSIFFQADLEASSVTMLQSSRRSTILKWLTRALYRQASISSLLWLDAWQEADLVDEAGKCGGRCVYRQLQLGSATHWTRGARLAEGHCSDQAPARGYLLEVRHLRQAHPRMLAWMVRILLTATDCNPEACPQATSGELDLARASPSWISSDDGLPGAGLGST